MHNYPEPHRSAVVEKAPIEGLTVTAIEPKEFGAFFREHSTSGAFHHICIDLAGSREATLFKALARSDLVIIPAQASEPDLREALVVAGDVRDVRETTARQIPYRLLLTKVCPLRTRGVEGGGPPRRAIPRQCATWKKCSSMLASSGRTGTCFTCASPACSMP